MLIQRGYKYELQVNKKERTVLAQYAGTARFAWNWGLAERKKQYQEQQGKARFTDAMKQHKYLNTLKKTAFPWMYDVSKCVPQEALRDLEQAFKNFVRDLKKSKQKKRRQTVGFPKFKKKSRVKASFRLTGVIKVFSPEKRIQLPRLGKLRLKETPTLPPAARILSATVSRTADRWYVALTTAVEIPDPPPNDAPLVALDAGLKVFAALSHGLPILKPKFLLGKLRKLRRLSKAHSRKKPGSKNKRKSARQLACFHRKVADTRRDFLHKTSTYLTKNHGVIVGEDLYIKGLLKNKHLSKYWGDLAHGEFQRMLTYKAAWNGAHFIKANRWFPSSKLCSNCLYYDPELTLAERVFKCPLCGLELDRDYNAALNLENYYHMYYPLLVSVAESSAETLNAGGEALRPTQRGLASMKQEAQCHLSSPQKSLKGRDG